MRYQVRHIAVQEDEGFDLLDNETVLDCEWIHPVFHLVLLLQDDGVNSD